MDLRLVASWSCVAAERPYRTWLRLASGSVGVHGADGRFVVWRAVEGAPEIAAVALPDDALVGLDPRGEWFAVAAAGRLELRALSGAGAVLATAAIDPALAVRDVEVRADGERVWVLGTIGDQFAAHAFARDLTLAGRFALALAQGPYPTTVNVHPREDAFVITTNEDRRDPDAPPHRLGLRVDGTALRTLFDTEIEYPCVGFTSDGSAVVGVDAFQGVTLLGWPDYVELASATPAEGDESRFDGAVVGARVVAECHPAGEIASSLWVLALPSLSEEARIAWPTRAEFGEPDDDAGLALAGALGDDKFLEATRAASGAWLLRVWRVG